MSSEENLLIGGEIGKALINHLHANHPTEQQWLQICAGIFGALAGGLARRCGVDITNGLLDNVKAAVELQCGEHVRKPH